uniref:Large ribosomal subunit protein mL54 n=1 Tax=Lynceus sp. MCZ IZ 141354 TaxID=1930659 RepID=A0A9N6ZGB6_9CRUS|nr:EOG090X0KWJ [Lynceus sp. MCZ IZ 141354]
MIVRVINQLRISGVVSLNHAATYAKAATVAIPSLGKKTGKGGKLGPIAEKKKLPVESDPEKLVNYVCGSNYFKTGEDIKLGPDEAYPDWLWTLRLGKPEPLESMDPNSIEYWRRVRKLALRRNNRLAATRRF